MADGEEVTVVTSLVCGNCGFDISDSLFQLRLGYQQPCEHCGSAGMEYGVGLGGGLALFGLLEIKHKRRGAQRPLYELITGRRVSKNGRLVQKLRVIDRERDRYQEQVTDVATGETFRNVDESLRLHQQPAERKTHCNDV